jgi:hypothetical protein
MKRPGLLVVSISAVLAFSATSVSGAAPQGNRTGTQAQAQDRVCAALIKFGRNRYSYPPDVDWVWEIPTGCVFVRDRGPTADCPVTECTLPPDVHVRYRQRGYVFHLTLKGLPETAKGMIRRGRRMIVATDGRAPKSRRRLLVYFTAGEFRGIENFGPRHIWAISVTIDKKKGLCCRRADPGNPGSPWDVPPDVVG